MDKYKIPNVKTFEYTKIIGLENIEFGNYVIIDDFVLIYAKNRMIIDNYVHIASFTSISGGGTFEIGEFAGIASGCRIITGSDVYSGYGIAGPTVSDEFRDLVVGSIKMERFTGIGANSIVLPNVTIGEGSRVSANSMITKDLAPWGIYVGNRRVADMNKKEVLENHERFLNAPKSERIGNLFLDRSDRHS